MVGLLVSPEAVESIYKVKQRNIKKPVGTILISDAGQVEDLTNQWHLKEASRYWPGPTSVILPLSSEFQYAHKGLGGLPFRVPADATLRDFIKKTGPLATSSANLEGLPPATSLKEARQYFGDHVEFYVDGGDLSDRQPSRIISFDKDGQEKEIRA